MSIAAHVGWRQPHVAVRDPFADYVSLLLIGDAIADRSQYQHAITNTGVVLSSAHAKFGGTSLYFDGTSWMEILAHPAMDMGSGDWTVEAWVRAETVVDAFQGIVAAKTRTPDGGYVFRGNNSRAMTIGGPNYADRGSTGGFFIADEWVFVAVQRLGDRSMFFVDGILTDNAPELTAGMTFDMSNGGSTIGYADFGYGPVPSATRQFLTGWLDGLRVTKGVARYAGSFDVPTEPFPPIV